MRSLARGLGRAILFVVQLAYALLLAVVVPMLTFAVLGNEKNALTVHWLPPASLGFWAVCWLAAAIWAGRARRRARAARWTPPPPPPPGQPMPESQQWPEMVGQATIRRLPDGSVLIEPPRTRNVA
jgi:hypothetical protein